MAAIEMDLARTEGAAENVASSATPSRRDIVLLALFEHGRPTATLLHAAALAGALGADLHVVRVLPDLTPVNALSPERNSVDAVTAVERTLASVRLTASWLCDALGDDGAARHFSVVHGEFIEQATACAADLEARMIVVPPREGSLGNVVTALACSANLPVLIARDGGSGDTIVAATDLESAEYPVLWTAANLAQRLQAPVVAVHNVSPRSATLDPATSRPGTTSSGSIVEEARSAELEAISSHLPVAAEAVVRQEVDAVEAIIDEARACDAELVVIGTRRRGWFERLVTKSVASRVINRTKRSVLVTPVDEPDEAPLFVGA